MTRYGSYYRKGRPHYLKKVQAPHARGVTGVRRCEVCDARGDVDRYEPLDLKRVCRKCAWTFTFEAASK